MSNDGEESEDVLSFPEEETETINIGLYIGGRNAKGERDGRGWAILPNGDQYDGYYRNGRRHGIGLYVFENGARYYGQYRCGHRSGRGIFIYPDGSVYEGMWRKSMRHGKGRYSYSNGDAYCGTWYQGLRHGVGTYTTGLLNKSATCEPRHFKGTWRHGVRVGPFEFSFGIEEKSTTLHGTWDNLFPQGPAVFTFDNRFMLLGYFQTPGHGLQLTRRRDNIETEIDELEEHLSREDKNNQGDDVWMDAPSLWYAQETCLYEYSLLPQEPVPLPLSDSEISVCSILTPSIQSSFDKSIPQICEGEEGEMEEEECICEHECSITECESSSNVCTSTKDPCAIEIVDQPEC